MTISFFCPSRFGRWDNNHHLTSSGECPHPPHPLLPFNRDSFFNDHFLFLPFSFRSVMTPTDRFRFRSAIPLVAGVLTRHIWCYLLTEMALTTISFPVPPVSVGEDNNHHLSSSGGCPHPPHPELPFNRDGINDHFLFLPFSFRSVGTPTDRDRFRFGRWDNNHHLSSSGGVPTRHIRRFLLIEIALMTISFFCPSRFGRWDNNHHLTSSGGCPHPPHPELPFNRDSINDHFSFPMPPVSVGEDNNHHLSSSGGCPHPPHLVLPFNRDSINEHFLFFAVFVSVGGDTNHHLTSSGECPHPPHLVLPFNRDSINDHFLFLPFSFRSVGTPTIISHLVAGVPTRHIRSFLLIEIALMTIFPFLCLPFRSVRTPTDRDRFRFGR
jgi:hypothetical protein